MWTKSEMTITELVDLSENCSRKGGASDESDKSVIKRIKTVFIFSHHENMASCPLCKYRTKSKKVLQNKN